MGVMRGVVLKLRDLRLTLDEVLGVVEIARISRNTVIATEVLGPSHFFARDQRFEELFAVARADDLDLVVSTQQIAKRLGKVTYGGGRGLLDEDIARTRMFESIEHQINRLVQ